MVHQDFQEKFMRSTLHPVTVAILRLWVGVLCHNPGAPGGDCYWEEIDSAIVVYVNPYGPTGNGMGLISAAKKQRRPYFPLNPGCLKGILIMVYSNPHSTV